jgi:DNA-binding winged helix-turn-helix (wHTH) protein
MNNLHDATDRIFEFGPFQFHADRDMLFAGRARVPLAPRPVAILKTLVEGAGEPVSCATLFSRVWPHGAISSHGVRAHVARLRKALATHGGATPFIGVTRDGAYSLLVPVTATSAVEAVHVARPYGKLYRFAGYLFAPDEQRLEFNQVVLGAADHAVALLHLFVERAGEVLTAEELLRFAWPDMRATRSHLRLAIATLRRTLSQAPGRALSIESLPGNAYRFNASVVVADASTAMRGRVSLPAAVRATGHGEALRLA